MHDKVKPRNQTLRDDCNYLQGKCSKNHNEYISTKNNLMYIMSTNECTDIFKDIQVNKQALVERKDHQSFISFKIKYKSRKILFNKL